MAREVVWTDPAWDDLESAKAYIARDSESYAAAFVEEVRAAANSLSEFAERGQVVPEFADPTVRELLVRPYRLVYRVTPDRVTVLSDPICVNVLSRRCLSPSGRGTHTELLFAKHM